MADNIARLFPDELDPTAAAHAEALLEGSRIAEALIFASADPVEESEIARRMPDGVDVREALEAVRAHYAGRGVNLARVNRKWMFRTATDLSWLLSREQTAQRERYGRNTLGQSLLLARRLVEAGVASSTEGGLVPPAVRRVAIASRSLRRCPTAVTPSSFSVSCVRLGRTVSSISFSRKAASYLSRPRLRSQSPISMVASYFAADEQ